MTGPKIDTLDEPLTLADALEAARNARRRLELEDAARSIVPSWTGPRSSSSMRAVRAEAAPPSGRYSFTRDDGGTK